ncbi:ankyrin repeat domain-containing protein [soil metagenome]
MLLNVLVYNELRPETIPGFEKVVGALREGNFAQADARKIGDNLYRARLNRTDRLLFSLHRAGGATCILLLEHIRNHAYDKSRFLRRGAEIDEARIPPLGRVEDASAADLPHVDPRRPSFNLLDKILSFDDHQDAVYRLSPPLIIVGAAGSGKTALTLEKMKQMAGDALYVSLSPYLVQNARSLYFSHNYDNEDINVDFLSFHEFIESIRIPEGREASLRDFQAWFERQALARKLRDAHKVFEEFRGVITGPVGEASWLSRADYLDLGVKQSIFAEDERPQVYDLFEKYLSFLDASGLYDSNIVSHQYRDETSPRYDFVVVDEVQDLTNVQLHLILKSLRLPGEFILTGDSNQIVHPNFFSWSSLKSLFFHERMLSGDGEIIRILHTNYRNAPVVIEVANRILKLKHARFGSVDRESNYLVDGVAGRTGRVQLVADSPEVKAALDSRTARSARVAVLVMHPDQKAEARRWFDTPLVFSVQEAKGLEYDSIILFNFISAEARAFREIARDVDPADLETDTLAYARARDKRDKSLEIYKFYINALYVAVTRAVRNLYWVEADPGHPAMALLKLDRFAEAKVAIEREASSVEEWQREARRLEMQGKADQARDIRDRVLKQKPAPWRVVERDGFEAGRRKALAGGNRKDCLAAFEYALLHWHLPTLNALHSAGFKPALEAEDKAVQKLNLNHFSAYEFRNPAAVMKDVEAYGVDHRTPFNLTPLMLAARMGNAAIVEALVERGADPSLTANHGFIALHFALERALTDRKFAGQKLASLYPPLAPASLDVQAGGRLIKLDQHLMEYFLLHAMSALFYRRLGPSIAGSGFHGGAFTANDLAGWLAALPHEVLPERRQRRAYISSILSKNEIDGKDPYNRRLFRRIRHGHYIVDPALKLRLNESWISYYALFVAADWGPYLPRAEPGPRSSGLEAIGSARWKRDRPYYTRMQEAALASFRTDVLGEKSAGPG